MPVKWSPETDQILLLKILETSQVNADVKAISEAWPDNLERPTPRAITERLHKIRSTAKQNGTSQGFSVAKPGAKNPGGPKKRGPDSSAGNTPTANKTLNKVIDGAVKKPGGSGSKKRKRAGMDVEGASSPSSATLTTENDSDASDSPSKKHHSAATKIKREANAEDSLAPGNSFDGASDAYAGNGGGYGMGYGIGIGMGNGTVNGLGNGMGNGMGNATRAVNATVSMTDVEDGTLW